MLAVPTIIRIRIGPTAPINLKTTFDTSQAKMAITREQFNLNHKQLLQKAGNCSTNNYVANSLLSAAKQTLELYPLLEDNETTSFDLPTPQEVAVDLLDFLIPPAEIFTKEFFIMLIFPATVIHEVAILYGFDMVPEEYVNSLGLSDILKNEK